MRETCKSAALHGKQNADLSQGMCAGLRVQRPPTRTRTLISSRHVQEEDKERGHDRP